MSWRVLHAPKRVSAASAALAGCGPLGIPGLALWLRGRGGWCRQGCLGTWQPPSRLEPRVPSFSPPPTPPPLSFSQAVLPAVLARSAAGTARPFSGDPSRSLIQPVGGDSGGACGMLQTRGKHAVTASVKLVAEAGIRGYIASLLCHLPSSLSVAPAGSCHRSPKHHPLGLKEGSPVVHVLEQPSALPHRFPGHASLSVSFKLP